MEMGSLASDISCKNAHNGPRQGPRPIASLHASPVSIPPSVLILQFELAMSIGRIQFEVLTILPIIFKVFFDKN